MKPLPQNIFDNWGTSALFASNSAPPVFDWKAWKWKTFVGSASIF